MTDSAPADHAATERTSRRALLGAGAVGAVLALTGARTVSAGASSSGSGLSEDDLAVAGFAIGLELTARDLYEVAQAAGSGGVLWHAMREQHEAYATQLAGISGLSADTRNEAVFEALQAGFDRRNPADAALDLENVAAATHTDLLSRVTELDLASAMASFVSMESRHATVLAGLAGRGDDFDALFLNSATALSPEDGS